MLEPSINRPADATELNRDLHIDQLISEDNDENLESDLSYRSTGKKAKSSLRKKATTWAIALSTLPIILVGGLAYYFADKSLHKQVVDNEQSAISSLEDKVELFIQDRYREARLLSNIEIFANPKISRSTSAQEKSDFLSQYISNDGVYDRVVAFDLNGNIIAQSNASKKFGTDESAQEAKNSPFHRKVIASKNVVFRDPYFSNWTQEMTMEVGVPIRENTTGAIVGLIRMRVPLKSMAGLLAQYQKEGKTVLLANDRGNIFLSNNQSLIRQNLKQISSQASEAIAHEDGKDEVTTHIGDREVVSHVEAEQLRESPYNLNWYGISIAPKAKLFAAQNELLTTLLGGTLIMALLASLIVSYLVSRATKFLEETTSTVQKIGQGELDAVLPVTGDDERAILADSINQMSGRIKDLLDQQQSETKRSDKIKQIVTLLAKYSHNDDIFNSAVSEIREAIGSSRVIVYVFDSHWKGTIVAESVVDDYPQALGATIADPCFADRYVQKYRQGRVQPTPNIYEAGLTSCHLNQLEPFAVKANLVAPIVLGEDKQLFGLLIAHQCDAPRNWTQSDIDLFSQLAIQVGFALDRANSLEEQKQAKEKLQNRALELLMEVDPISQGDLTVRASVTEDEIGTIADSYNAMVTSLRKVVIQVQQAAQQMASTTSDNQELVRDLSEGAIEQTVEIDRALQRIQEMSDSISKVSSNVREATNAVRQANATVAAGDASLNRTVEGILAIQQTVAETSTKAQQLGLASEKISKVVNLINGFAEQTNLLALNAAIEAARAGEEGRGFAVVADEVGNLARQSTAATVEIENIITEIQRDAKELVAAMVVGNREVLKGSQLADETRQSLNKIVEVSNYIERLVQEIAQTTVVQSAASEAVAETMTDVAAISNQTSQEVASVSKAFRDLLSLAEQLQTSARQFKVS